MVFQGNLCSASKFFSWIFDNFFTLFLLMLLFICFYDSFLMHFSFILMHVIVLFDAYFDFLCTKVYHKRIMQEKIMLMIGATHMTSSFHFVLLLLSHMLAVDSEHWRKSIVWVWMWFRRVTWADQKISGLYRVDSSSII